MPDDFIRPIEVAITSSLKDIQETISHIEESLKSTSATIIAANEASQRSINDDNKKSASDINKANKKANDEKNKSTEETADRINEKQKSTAEEVSTAIASAAIQATSKITSKFREMLQTYTNEQQKLSYGLIGSGMDYDTVRSALSVMGSNAFIQQQRVYNNLTALVSSGITMNAAQRAYLQTAAEQVGLQFRASDDALNRLIQLQQADLSEARLAQMAGLREFLEVEYKNSQYIYNGFNQVSSALLEMQSLMTAQVALSTEKTIQGYLGAFTSAGGSKSSNIAQAIGQIGAGDFNLEQGMQNLMIMAASKAGLSYADILTQGLDANTSEALMQALFKYIASMGGTGSNVAMNAMAKVFGVSVSDIIAAKNMKLENLVGTNYSSDISNFFAQVAASTNESVMLNTWWNNAISNQALKSNFGLVGFDLLNDLSSIIGSGLESAGQAQSSWGGPLISLMGTGIKNLTTITTLMGILKDFKDAKGNESLFSDPSKLFKLDTLKQIATGDLSGVIMNMLQAIGGGFSSDIIMKNYQQLGGMDNSYYYNTYGDFSGIRGGETESGVISNDEEETEPPTTIKFEYDEQQEGHSFEDLYRLLADDYPVTTFSTIANIPNEVNNNIYLVDRERTQYVIDMITITAVSTENILMLLENSLGGANRSLIDMNALGLVNMWGDWSGTTGGGGE